MNLLNIPAVAVGLGMDAMSVSAAIGVKWHGPRQTFRLALSMGLFQFLMPLVGWAGGKRLADVVARFGPSLAAAMLFAIAAKMLYEAYRRHPGEVEEKVEAEAEHLIEKVAHVHPKDPTKGWSLLFLAVATSLDALVVGFSLGLKEEGRIWLTSVVIGLVAAGMSLMGVMVGRRVGGVLGPVAETIGALVLIGLGVSFLLF